MSSLERAGPSRPRSAASRGLLRFRRRSRWRRPMNPAHPPDNPNRQLDVLPGVERSGRQSEPGPVGVAAGGSHCDMATGVDDTAHLNRLPLMRAARRSHGRVLAAIPAGSGRPHGPHTGPGQFAHQPVRCPPRDNGPCATAALEPDHPLGIQIADTSVSGTPLAWSLC